MLFLNEGEDRDAVPQLIIYTTHHAKMSFVQNSKINPGITNYCRDHCRKAIKLLRQNSVVIQSPNLHYGKR